MSPIDPSTIHIRDLYGHAHGVTVAQLASAERNKPLIVEVPGFGHLVVGQAPTTNEPIVSLAPPTYLVVLAQPNGDGEPVLHPRDFVKTEHGIEVELLPNRSGEDRLVVCVPWDMLEPLGELEAIRGDL